MKPILALALSIALTGCSLPSFHNADVSCVRHKLAYGGDHYGPLPFPMAIGFCVHYDSDDKFGLINVRQVPFDFRADPDLQVLIENAASNPEKYEFISPKTGMIDIPH